MLSRLGALPWWRPDADAERALVTQLGWVRVLVTALALAVVAAEPDISADRGLMLALLMLVWLPASGLQVVLARRLRGHSFLRRLCSIGLDVAAVATFLFLVPQPALGPVVSFMIFVGLHAVLDSYAGGLLVTALGAGALLLATRVGSTTGVGSLEVAVFLGAGLATTALVGYSVNMLEANARRVARSYALAKDQLALSLEAAETGLWEWDIARDRIEWSAETLRIFGCPDAPGDNAAFLELVHPDDRATLQERFTAAIAEGGSYQVHHRIIRDGRTRWLIGKGRVFTDEHGTAVRLMGAVTDVTDQREQQLQLEQVRRMETVTGLAGGFAHDFNNILAVITMTAEVLRRSPLDDSQLERVEFLLEATRRGAEVSNKLLVFARRESGHAVPVRLDVLVAGVTPMLERALRADIRLVVSIPSALPSIVVDPALFEQALLNLAVNARDAIPGEGEVRISARVAAAGDHPAVVIEVADTGIGMTEEVRDHALEPFFTTKGPDRGTGLGLASVYSMVTAVDGTVEIDSMLGLGTVVRMRLPTTSAVPHDGRPAPATQSVDAPARVLVVDDDPGIRSTLCELLAGLGHEVVSAEDGREALELIASHSDEAVHLVITDVVMPELSGPALVAELQRRGVSIPVVYMTGYTGHEPGLPESAPVLHKPFTAAELSTTVTEALRGARESADAS